MTVLFLFRPILFPFFFLSSLFSIYVSFFFFSCSFSLFCSFAVLIRLFFISHFFFSSLVFSISVFLLRLSYLLVIYPPLSPSLLYLSLLLPSLSSLCHSVLHLTSSRTFSLLTEPPTLNKANIYKLTRDIHSTFTYTCIPQALVLTL